MRDDRPQITAETFRNMEDMSFFTHARIFDDLLIIAQKETNCFVLRSSEGLIVLDAIWPCQQAFDAIISAVRETGWDPGAIRKLVLTHGHVDHTGCGRWLREAFHAETYLSQRMTDFGRKSPSSETGRRRGKTMTSTSMWEKGMSLLWETNGSWSMRPPDTHRED